MRATLRPRHVWIRLSDGASAASDLNSPAGNVFIRERRSIKPWGRSRASPWYGVDVNALTFAEQAKPLHDRLTRVTYLICGDRELAEESAQEALVRAWERVDDGAELDSLEAWTTTVAMNWCRSQLRRRGAERRAVVRLDARRSTGRPGVAADHALSDDVRSAVLALPQRQREVVVLHYVLDLDIAAIAERAEITAGAVKNALFNARKTLAQRLGQDEPAPLDERHACPPTEGSTTTTSSLEANP